MQDYAESYARHKTFSGVAHELGLDESTIRRSLRARWRKQEIEDATDEGIRQAASAAGIQSVAALHSGWVKAEAGSFYFKVPTTEAAQSIVDQLHEALADVPTAPLSKPPKVTNADLLTVYPIADAHIGMLAWAPETGEDYDTRIASERVCDWMGRVVAASPAADTAVILDVGDTVHADDQSNMTPASKHILDTDTRYFKTLDVAVWTLVQAVQLALAKHRRVIVCILKGNHDPHASVAIMFALAAHFRNDPRVEVQKKPGDFFAMEWGKCMFAATHGDKAKAEGLVMELANRHAPMWGRTVYRYLFTGHLHHHKSADIGGMTWEQLSALTAKDHYAFSHAFSGRAQLSGITYHREDGVKYRTFVNA